MRKILFGWMLLLTLGAIAGFIPAETLIERLKATTSPAEQIKLRNQIAESLLNSKPTESINYAQQALEAAKATNDKSGEGLATALIGVGDYKTDHSTEAEDMLNKADAIATTIHDNSLLAFCKYWKGSMEQSKGNYTKALELYQAGLDLAQAAGDKRNLVRCMDGKGSIFDNLNEKAKAKELYEQTLTLAKQIDFKEWIPGQIFSLGSVAMDEGNTDKAIAYFNESLTLSDEVNNLNNKAACMQQLATIYFEHNDLKKAIDYTQQAMEIFQNTGAMSSYSYSQLLLGKILLRDGQPQYAIEIGQKAYEAGKTYNELNLQKEAAYLLYEANVKKGDRSRALDYHVEYFNLNEKVNSSQMAQKVSRLAMKENYDREKEIARITTAKREAEMQAQLRAQRIIRNATLAVLLLLIAVAGIAIYAYIQKRKDNTAIGIERQKSEDLLLNILPEEVATELKEKGSVNTRHFSTVSVLFADIRNFTQAGESMSPEKLVGELDFIFKAFDKLVAKYGIEKIKTIGDAYLCAGGLPNPDPMSPYKIVDLALDMQTFMAALKVEREARGEHCFEIRIGIHTGPLVAGIVGIKKFGYDIWGDTVNIAARMEQSGQVGKVNIGGPTYEIIKDLYICTHRGKIEAKNKGEIDMYFVERKKA